MQIENQDACISIAAVAAKLSLSRRTVNRLVARGDLPTLKIGHRRLIRVAALRHWLTAHEAPTPGAHASDIGRQRAAR